MNRKLYTPEEDARILAVVSEAGKGERKIAFQLLAEELGRTPKAITLRFHALQRTSASTSVPTESKSETEILQAIRDVFKDRDAWKDEALRLRYQLAEMEKTLENTRNYYKARVAELEEDQAAFLRLMDKARGLALNED